MFNELAKIEMQQRTIIQQINALKNERYAEITNSTRLRRGHMYCKLSAGPTYHDVLGMFSKSQRQHRCRSCGCA